MIRTSALALPEFAAGGGIPREALKGEQGGEYRLGNSPVTSDNMYYVTYTAPGKVRQGSDPCPVPSGRGVPPASPLLSMWSPVA